MNISLDRITDNVVRINIVGVGGGGNNAVNRMVECNLPMVRYISINTDNGAFNHSKAEVRLQIGSNAVRGLGAGADPEKGRLSAEESWSQIEKTIKDCDMLFITAGMGGGTGTGAAPVIADIARSHGILTVAVVTEPFYFEGRKRMEQAKVGIARLEASVDSLIVIPNDNLKLVSDTKITLNNAFAAADDVLMQTVKNIVEVVQQTAFINCDFADICSVIKDSGYMHTATGRASGEERADAVVEQIVSSKLLESSVESATGILLCITAAGDVGLEEIDKISSSVSEKAHPNANVIFGMNFDETMDNELKAVLIATHRKDGGTVCTEQ